MYQSLRQPEIAEINHACSLPALSSVAVFLDDGEQVFNVVLGAQEHGGALVDLFWHNVQHSLGSVRRLASGLLHQV